MVKERIDSEGYEPISGGGNTPLRDAFNRDRDENGCKKSKDDESYDYKLTYKEDSLPVKSSIPRSSKSAIKPLPDPLPIAAGFYFDDEQIGWEIFQHEFGEPQSIVCRAAFPRKDKKDIYDIISIAIPITKDADGLYIFDDSRLLREQTNLANASRRDALLFTASFANSSVANTEDHQQRDLPRLNERDGAFISLLKSIDKQIGDTSYRLSDIVSFFRIEDIIKHPLLAQDIPQSLQENQDIEVELDNGTTLTSIGRMPEPRSRDYLTTAAFKRQTLVRSVTIDEPKTLPVTLQIQRVEPNTSLRLRPPGFLQFVFNREKYKAVELFNEFSHQLAFFGLRITESELPNKEYPFKGMIIIENVEGIKFKFKTVLGYEGGDPKRDAVFRIQSATKYGNFEEISNSFFGKSTYKSGINDTIKGFAHDMAKQTYVVFRRELKIKPETLKLGHMSLG